MKKILLLFTCLAFAGLVTAAAQSAGGITGKVVSRQGRQPVEGAKVTLGIVPAQVAVTNSEGVFRFEDIPYGTYRLTVSAIDFLPTEVNVRADMPLRDIGFVSLAPELLTDDFDDSAFAEFDTDESGGASWAPGSLSASRDLFDNVAGYQFGQLRFRTRGYETNTEQIMMNGILMNDALNGNPTWSLWSGLNDATRNQEIVNGLNINQYGVGGINGITNINANAASVRKGFRASVSSASAQYLARVMLTYASGARDDGWSYAFSVSTRQGANLWVHGVYYDAWAYFAAAEKRFNDRHRLGLTFFGVPTERGAQMAATQETYDLVGSNFYNPNYGYQDGDRRNARVRDYHEPVAILNYWFTPTDRTKLNVAAAFRFGKNGYSALDWHAARDPRPDYYRNLPSFYLDGLSNKVDVNKAEALEYNWRNNVGDIRHVDWKYIYDVNYNETEPTLGPGGNVIQTGRRSQYILSDRRTDQRDFQLKAEVAHLIRSNMEFHAGASYRYNRTEFYTKIKDLLGGDYWVNIDNFADRDFGSDRYYEKTLNDISGHSPLIVHKGDKYGYDYYGHIHQAKVWGTYQFNYGQWEGFAALDFGMSSFWRQGLFQKGLFPLNSYGDSDKKTFFEFTGKLGASYSITAAHKVSASLAFLQRAPYFSDAFLSPRTRNSLVPTLDPEKIFSFDVSYQMRLPYLQMRLAGYVTTITDQTKLISFYDDSWGAFSNFAMWGIDQRFVGLELGFRVPVVTGFDVTGALSWGDYVYTNNPKFTQTVDNSDAILLQNATVFWKNSKVESTPQLAANVGLNYRSGTNWFIGLDFNYFNNMYISMNPLYRTDKVNALLSPEQQKAMTHQEKFKHAFVLNANVGKVWYVNGMQVGLNLEVKNILNDKNIRTGGFEQMRLRERDEDTGTSYWSRFPSKYFYLYGINYYLSAYIRF